MQPYESCPAFEENNKAEKLATSEVKKFESSPMFSQTVSDISSRLGFKFPLKTEQVLDIFDMCRFDQAWNLGHPSPWCAAFTPSHVNVLEYREDIHYYYKSGYGHALNEKLACATVADMMKHLESKELPQMIGYFAHASTIQLLSVALGIAKNAEPLRADNYLAQSRRRWKSSEISPFAANLAAIKYDCPNDSERNKIMFFLNEKPVDLDWCRVGLCNWSDVKRHYEHLQNANCAEIFCSGNSASAVGLSAITAVLPLAIGFIIYQLFR